MAQDPPGSLPTAFQERFCLSSRHVRCEMYKYAQESDAPGGIPADQLHAAGAGTSVRTAVLGSSDGESRRPAAIAAIGIGGVAIIVFLFVLLLGSCSGDSGTTPGGAEGSPAAQTAGALTPTPEPTPDPTPEPTTTPDDDGDEPGTTDLPASAALVIRYEVQEDERLLKIADKFSTTRQTILRANEGMEDRQPYVEPGDEIIVPVGTAMTIEEVEAISGYLGLAEGT
jgi:hypothetical protein